MPKDIIITTQTQLNKLKEVKVGQKVVIKAALRLPGILKVYGELTIKKPLDCDWYQDRHVEASGSATVEASDSATVEGLGLCNRELTRFCYWDSIPLG